ACERIEIERDQHCASFETAASRLPQDEDYLLMPSMAFPHAEERLQPRLEAPTTAVQPFMPIRSQSPQVRLFRAHRSIGRGFWQDRSHHADPPVRRERHGYATI